MTTAYRFLKKYGAWGNKIRISAIIDDRMRIAFKDECDKRGITMSTCIDTLITHWTMKKSREIPPRRMNNT